MNATSVYKTEAGRQAIMSYYDSLLKNWPVPHEILTLPTRHGNTCVIACGEKAAPALFLLHGSCSNSAMWLGDIPQYIQQYRVYAVDILGEPGRSDQNRPPLDGPAYAEWLEDLFDALKLQTAILIGCSLGGWMSLKFATSRPQRVKKLVLLCPSGIAPAKLSFMFKTLPLGLLGEWGIKKANKLVYGGQPIPEDAEAFGTLIMKHFKPRYALPIFSDEELQRLTMPTLLIAGAQDILLPSAKTAARLRQFVPRLQANILPDTGHVLLNTTDDIMTFLAS